jgi:hypothetical protein
MFVHSRVKLLPCVGAERQAGADGHPLVDSSTGERVGAAGAVTSAAR